MISIKSAIPSKNVFQNSLEILSTEESSEEEDKVIFKVKPPQEFRQILKQIERENKQKDEEIKSLRKQLLEDSSLKDQLHHDMDEETKHKKIRDLAKKIKRLTVAFERERAKNAALEAQANTSIQPKSIKPPSDERVSQLAQELKILREKQVIVSFINKAIRKIEDERMQNQNLQKEIRNLHKVLTKELGEGYSIEKLLKSESTIKGRTEQIAILKEKVKQLTNRVHAMEHSDRPLSESSSKSQPRKSPTDHNGLYKLELSKRKELEKVQQELTSTKKQLHEFKSKNEGLMARIKILEDHKRQSKNQIAALIKKADDDDTFIQALRDELQKSSRIPSNVQKLQVQVAEQEQLIVGLRKEKESHSVSQSRASMRDDCYDRLIESLQLELQIIRQNKQQLEAKLAQEQAQNVQFKTTIEKLEDQLKRNRPEKRNADIQSYIDKIDVLRDENEALKLSIQATLDSKQQDLKMYQHLLDNARREIENE